MISGHLFPGLNEKINHVVIMKIEKKYDSIASTTGL
jgi:hypothetical protein